MYAQEIYIKSQRGRKEKNKQTVQCAGNVGDQVAIGFSFESDWLRGWREFQDPITWRSEAEPKQSESKLETILTSPTLPLSW